MLGRKVQLHMAKILAAPRSSNVRWRMLSSLLAPDSISLDLAVTSRDEVLTELAALLPLSPNDRTAVQKLLKQREGLGSTGVGRGIAIPHARTSLIDDLRLAYGRSEERRVGDEGQGRGGRDPPTQRA